MPGLRFHETMTGTFYRLDAPTDERPMHFTIDVVIASLPEFLRDNVARIEGDVTIEIFADRGPLAGTLAFRLNERSLQYEFGFKANDGQTYRFRGQKNVNLLAVVESLTTLPASVYATDGREMGRATVRFDVKSDLRKFLRSFRLTA